MATESHLLRVVEVVEETADARSVVFEIPDALAETFAYTPGQFLTLAIPSDRTGLVARNYSLSTAPHEGVHRITVKRTPDGFASGWIKETLRPGDLIRVLPPSGIFTPTSLDEDLLLFAGGSGITPVLSIARHALERGQRRVVLFYANRDESSVIFAGALRALAAAHPDRFSVLHWLESVQGLPSTAQVHAFAAAYDGYEAFTCGPKPFMDAVTEALKSLGLPRSRRHVEKFVSLGGNPFGVVPELGAFSPPDAVEARPDDPALASRVPGTNDTG